MSETVPLLLDTDIGSDIDDAVCLAYLLSEPRCDLLGVTTVSGQPRKRAMLADAVCRAAGQQDVPIRSGCDDPLLIEQYQSAAPQAEVLPEWEHREGFAPYEAVEFLRRTIRGRPGEITLLTIGPLTNAGLLCAVDPEAFGMLKRVVMMAGRYFSGERKEHNVNCDPIAAELAFAADGPPVTVYGLDVTLQCRLPAEECRRRFRGGPFEVVRQMAEVWFRERDRITFHDPLAAACIFEPGLCRYRDGRITVHVQQDDQFGQTTFAETPDGEHRAACEVDADRFFERYFAVTDIFRSD